VKQEARTGARRGEDRGGVGQEGRKEGNRKEKNASRRGRQMGRQTLLGVQTQASIIQPLRMGRTRAATLRESRSLKDSSGWHKEWQC